MDLKLPYEIAKSLTLSTLPAPISAIITAIQDVNDEKELAAKFTHLKELISEINDQTVVPLIPIAIEKILVSMAVIYVDQPIDNAMATDITNDFREIRDESDIDTFLVLNNMIYLNTAILVDKNELSDFIGNNVKSILKAYRLQISALAFI